jgi:predicted O-methyltransferase YrrM
MSLDSYLRSKNKTILEGYSSQVPQQVKDLIELTSKPNINVLEIGFNAGHSADIFLKNNKTLKLTSIDIGNHDYVRTGKQYIDDYYPNRHLLIIGNSLSALPTLAKNYNAKYDVIFIDGGHDYDVAKGDLDNCFWLSHEDTIVIMDDTVFTNDLRQFFNIGPTNAWTASKNNNKIIELSRKEYDIGRGMSYGKYVFSKTSVVEI